MFLEKTLLIITIYTYAASAIALIIGLVFDNEKWNKWGMLLVWLALLANTATLASRWHAVGHGPYISRYEVFLSNTWVATVLYLFFVRIWPVLKNMAAFIMPIIFLGLGAVYMSPAEIVYLSPSQRSTWLIVHIAFAKLTSGAILVATSLALAYLIQDKQMRFAANFMHRLPDKDKCDRLMYKMTVCAFLFTGMMIISGSIWGNQLWGRYWGWDPLETWSLVVWLVYGLFLHLRITFKFKGERSAYYIIAAFFFTALSFFVLPYVLDTIHNAYMVN